MVRRNFVFSNELDPQKKKQPHNKKKPKQDITPPTKKTQAKNNNPH